MLREEIKPTGYVHHGMDRIVWKPLVAACRVQVGDTVRHEGEDWLVDDVDDSGQFTVVLYCQGHGMRFDNSDWLWLVGAAELEGASA